MGDEYGHCRRSESVAVSATMLVGDLCTDNQELTRFLRFTHEICDRHNDVATASSIENWIDETERRTWFLSEITHDP